MSEKTLNAAIKAVYELQLNTKEAVNYVVRRSGDTAEQALLAINQALVGYKKA